MTYFVGLIRLIGRLANIAGLAAERHRLFICIVCRELYIGDKHRLRIYFFHITDFLTWATRQSTLSRRSVMLWVPLMGALKMRE